MKIHISHKKIKRLIDGDGFNVCGSRDELLSIAEQLRVKASEQGFTFGWVKIRDEYPDTHQCAPNSLSFAWGD